MAKTQTVENEFVKVPDFTQFQAEFSKWAGDFGKYFVNGKAPRFDFDAVFALQRKNVEAFPAANQETYTSYDTFSGLLPEDTFNTIVGGEDSSERKLYSVALSALDSAVEATVDTLTTIGQLENTYLILTSDNGGCYQAGAKNGLLRGTKGSLFEGWPIIC